MMPQFIWIVSLWMLLLLLGSTPYCTGFSPPSPGGRTRQMAFLSSLPRSKSIESSSKQESLFGMNDNNNNSNDKDKENDQVSTATSTKSSSQTKTSAKTRADVADAWLQEALETQDPPPFESTPQQQTETQQQQQQNHNHPSTVYIYDTSLRDGTQGESISCSCQDKFKIANALMDFGVDYVEAGWPGSNPKDEQFFQLAQQNNKGDDCVINDPSKLVAFGSTRRKGIRPQEDAQLQALVDSNAPTICLVAKSSLWQVEEILRTTPEENVAMIADSVRYLSETHGRKVMVDLEHFFDGYRANPAYVQQCCLAALRAGASCLVLCDTNGGTMPWEVYEATQSLYNFISTSQQQDDEFNNAAEKKEILLGIHAHNDCGMAVANSLSAVRAGARLVQGTVNGIGERTGNADLCSIIPSLALHNVQVGDPAMLQQKDFSPRQNEDVKEEETKVQDDVVATKNKDDDDKEEEEEEDKEHPRQAKLTCRDNLSQLMTLSRYVDEIFNRPHNPGAPYVGTSAFAHKGGLHVAAMKRNAKSYQHVDPAQVGNEQRVLISELSGRQNILGKFQNVLEQQHQLQSDKALAILNRVKELESKGYTFEGAEASVHLMILHASRGYCPPFTVLDYSAQVYDNNNRADRGGNENNNNNDSTNAIRPTARATVKIRTLDLEDDGMDESWTGFDQVVGNKNNNATTTSLLKYKDRLEVSDGTGPVDALAAALKRALVPAHPSLENVELVDYKVRILDPEQATGAATRVMVEFADKVQNVKWTTVSVDRNIISASLNAIVDGFEYALVEHAPLSCMLCDEAY